MMVVVLTTEPEVAVIVLLLPAAVGVRVGKVLNTPALNAAEVPEAPAVPPNVTIPVNVLGPLLQMLPLASSAVILVKLLLTDEPAVAAVIVVGFIISWLIVPGLMVTLPDVPVYPLVAEVAVKLPVAAFPVYFNASAVRFATPEVKSAAFVNLLVPDNPDIEPVNGKLGVIVTLLAEASKVVIVFP